MALSEGWLMQFPPEQVVVRLGITLRLGRDDLEYLGKCAKLRKIGQAQLIRRILRTVARDQLVGAILDDLGN
jgi:hypothetical protein